MDAPSRTQIFSLPPPPVDVWDVFRSEEEADSSLAGRGGTGVVDRDGAALSLSDPGVFRFSGCEQAARYDCAKLHLC